MAAEQYLLAGILIIGAALAKISQKYKFPYPIPLILAGMVLRVALPSETSLDLLGIDFIAQLTLATVLFYAGLTMNIKELRLSIRPILALATAGVLLTSLIAGFVIITLFASIGLTAFLIGAILSPTDPAALFSVLESGGVRVKRKLFSVLEGEAVFNDATAVILVITVFTPLVVPALAKAWYIVLGEFVGSIVFGVVIGYLVAYTIGKVIIRAGDQTNVTILTAVTPIVAYGLGELLTFLGFHPGAMAAVFSGIFMANARRAGIEPLPQQTMRGTMKNVSFAFEIVVFILLGYEVNTDFVLNYQPVPGVTILTLGLVVGLLVIFVARPTAVFLVTAPDRSISFRDRFFVSWAGVKGVASAALAAIAVSIIETPVNGQTVPNADILGQTITSLIFVVLMMTLVVQGLTAPIIAEKLELKEEEHEYEQLSTQRDATRHALLHLVDEYTEGKIDSKLYQKLKAELEEEIYALEDELRRVVAEKRQRLMELDVREELCRQRMEYYEKEYEKGKLPSVVYEDRKDDLESEINEIAMMRRHCEES